MLQRIKNITLPTNSAVSDGTSFMPLYTIYLTPFYLRWRNHKSCDSLMVTTAE